MGCRTAAPSAAQPVRSAGRSLVPVRSDRWSLERTRGAKRPAPAVARRSQAPIAAGSSAASPLAAAAALTAAAGRTAPDLATAEASAGRGRPESPTAMVAVVARPMARLAVRTGRPVAADPRPPGRGSVEGPSPVARAVSRSAASRSRPSTMPCRGCVRTSVRPLPAADPHFQREALLPAGSERSAADSSWPEPTWLPPGPVVGVRCASGRSGAGS